MLLRGLAKLVAAVVAAGLAGLALGTGLAALAGETESPEGVAGGPPAAPPPVTNTSTTRATPTTTTTTTPARKQRASTQTQEPANDPRVRIVSAILHRAASSSGKRRQRARLSVHVR